jgi:ribonuclease HI
MPKPAKPKVTIYTDGACAANGTAQSRGGWAAILVYDDTGQAKELSGGTVRRATRRWRSGRSLKA